ncbi:hypothetical protein X777_06881 [Ooceraea biroi]|uniref:Uncharacterized protein n=1 Tax=Ooceraea biroi TaxID=2015173 RepID=A0A026WC28_OOCBI|nr:hypothetical protein X777_06881 [Ooceraea biroi]
MRSRLHESDSIFHLTIQFSLRGILRFQITIIRIAVHKMDVYVRMDPAPPRRRIKQHAKRSEKRKKRRKRISTSCGIAGISLYGLVVERKEDVEKQQEAWKPFSR